jgi:hypothetical protein
MAHNRPPSNCWEMDGYVPLQIHPVGNLEVTVFAFGGGTPPPEDGIYFVNARLLAVTADTPSF